MVKKIAEYIVETGINSTTTGNWHIDFDEINTRFGTNLPADNDVLEKVQDYIFSEYPDKVVEMDCSEDFDLIFYTDCCPNYIEENEP